MQDYLLFVAMLFALKIPPITTSLKSSERYLDQIQILCSTEHP